MNNLNLKKILTIIITILIINKKTYGLDNTYYYKKYFETQGIKTDTYEKNYKKIEKALLIKTSQISTENVFNIKTHTVVFLICDTPYSTELIKCDKNTAITLINDFKKVVETNIYNEKYKIVLYQNANINYVIIPENILVIPELENELNSYIKGINNIDNTVKINDFSKDISTSDNTNLKILYTVWGIIIPLMLIAILSKINVAIWIKNIKNSEECISKIYEQLKVFFYFFITIGVSFIPIIYLVLLNYNKSGIKDIFEYIVKVLKIVNIKNLIIYIQERDIISISVLISVHFFILSIIFFSLPALFRILKEFKYSNKTIFLLVEKLIKKNLNFKHKKIYLSLIGVGLLIVYLTLITKTKNIETKNFIKEDLRSIILPYNVKGLNFEFNTYNTFTNYPIFVNDYLIYDNKFQYINNKPISKLKDNKEKNFIIIYFENLEEKEKNSNKTYIDFLLKNKGAIHLFTTANISKYLYIPEKDKNNIIPSKYEIEIQIECYQNIEPSTINLISYEEEYNQREKQAILNFPGCEKGTKSTFKIPFNKSIIIQQGTLFEIENSSYIKNFRIYNNDKLLNTAFIKNPKETNILYEKYTDNNALTVYSFNIKKEKTFVNTKVLNLNQLIKDLFIQNLIKGDITIWSIIKGINLTKVN